MIGISPQRPLKFPTPGKFQGVARSVSAFARPFAGDLTELTNQSSVGMLARYGAERRGQRVRCHLQAQSNELQCRICRMCMIYQLQVTVTSTAQVQYGVRSTYIHTCFCYLLHKPQTPWKKLANMKHLANQPYHIIPSHPSHPQLSSTLIQSHRLSHPSIHAHITRVWKKGVSFLPYHVQ